MKPVAVLILGWMMREQELRWWEMLEIDIVLMRIMLLADRKGS
jgi:hypothetical protein